MNVSYCSRTHAKKAARASASTVSQVLLARTTTRTKQRAGVIHCETEEDNYSFEVHAYDGSFLVEQQNGKMQYVSDLVIEGVGDAHWENVSSNGEIQPWDGEKTFLGVLIKRDDKYVGYATIMIERPENNWRYNATIINCKELSPEERSNSEIMPEDLYIIIN